MGLVVPGFPFLELDSRFTDHPNRANPFRKPSALFPNGSFPGDEQTYGSFLQVDTSAMNPGDVFVINKVVQKIVACTAVESGWSDGFDAGFTGYKEFILDIVSSIMPPLSFPTGNQVLVLQNNRQFKLPNGDFGRMLNYYWHKDSLGAGQWCYIYYFLYPILIRWEYWKLCANADPEFYDSSTPYYASDNFQNGLNHFWQHYQKPAVIALTGPTLITEISCTSTVVVTGTYTDTCSANYEIKTERGGGDLLLYRDNSLIQTIALSGSGTYILTSSGLTFTVNITVIAPPFSIDWTYQIYYKPAWVIRYVLELWCTLNNVPKVIRQNITLRLEDRNSNADWINKWVKMYQLDGITEMPIVAGLYTMYTGQDTMVVARFEKVIGWDSGRNEIDGVSGIIWIEVFESGGITSRLRGSSSIPLTTEACFVEDDTNITPGGSEHKVIAQVVYLRAVIDHTKLPTGTKFTINARIYGQELI